jgi:hypothetical protein
MARLPHHDADLNTSLKLIVRSTRAGFTRDILLDGVICIITAMVRFGQIVRHG